MALKIPIAITHDGNPVHIDDSEKTMGPFTCPGCGGEVGQKATSVAHRRAGDTRDRIVRGHFFHRIDRPCANGLETALHLWGKMIIEEAIEQGRTLHLPEHRVGRHPFERSYQDEYAFTHAELEVFQEGIRPDLVAHHPEGSLNVEIRVHHAVDETKAAVLKDRGASCIEIDLGKLDFDAMSGDVLRSAILIDAPRIWISHAETALRLEDVERDIRDFITAEGARLGNAIRDASYKVGQEVLDRHEREIAGWGTEAFIGRQLPGQIWFAASPRNWQHALLMERLRGVIEASARPRQLPIRMPITNIRIATHPFQKDGFGIDEADEFIEAAGFQPCPMLRSPLVAYEEYLSTLCSEPIRKDVHPAVSHLLRFGSDPGTMVVNPAWAGYNHRRHYELRKEFASATRILSKRPPNYEAWLNKPITIPLASERRTPKALCLDGGPDYHRLLAHLKAIQNMLDGGWPVRNLLGLDLRWYRDRRRAEYDAPLPEGGCRPFLLNVFRTCPSSFMMRRGQRGRDILSKTSALSLHPDLLEEFLSTPHVGLGGATPREFAIDIPTMQYCIDLLPPPFAENRPNLRRQW